MRGYAHRKDTYLNLSSPPTTISSTFPPFPQLMADVRFLFHLQHFPKDNINAETVDLMMPYLNYHLYTYEAALQACGDVAGLLQWTISMVSFYGINKDVLPLKVVILLINIAAKTKRRHRRRCRRRVTRNPSHLIKIYGIPGWIVR